MFLRGVTLKAASVEGIRNKKKNGEFSFNILELYKTEVEKAAFFSLNHATFDAYLFDRGPFVFKIDVKWN